MKKLIKYFSVCALIAFTILCAFGKVGTIYRNAASAIGLITESMMLLSAGNTTWNFSQDIHGFVQAPTVANKKLDRYLSGENTWGTFDDLYRDPALGPYAPLAKNQLLIHDTTRWGPLPAPTAPGQVLQVGDNPSIFGVGTDDVFWGASPTGGGNVSVTPGSGFNGKLTRFDADDGTHVTKINEIDWNGTGLTIAGDFSVNTGDVNIQNDLDVGGSITVNGQTFSGASSGKYNPTVTPVSAVDTATATNVRWARIGDIVTVSGELQFVSTGTGSSTREITIDLPSGLESDLTAREDLSGVGALSPSSGSDLPAGRQVQVYANTLANTARFIFASTTQTFITFSFTYEIK